MASETLFFLYDSNGLRSIKSTSAANYHYYYIDDLLTAVRRIPNRMGEPVTRLKFVYDELGRPYSLYYDNGTRVTSYWYILNLQGDVTHLVDNNNIVA